MLVGFPAGIQGSWEGHCAAGTILGRLCHPIPHVISGKLCSFSKGIFSSIKGFLEPPRALLSPEEPQPDASLPASQQGRPRPLDPSRLLMALALTSATPLLGRPLGRGCRPQQVAGRVEPQNLYSHICAETLATRADKRRSQRWQVGEDTARPSYTMLPFGCPTNHPA